MIIYSENSVSAECDKCHTVHDRTNFVGDMDMERAEDWLRLSLHKCCWEIEENQVTCPQCWMNQ